MKKVKHILEIFVHSLIPQDIYYPKLLHTKLSFSLHYYLFIIICFSLLYTSIVFSQFSPMKIVDYKTSFINALSVFPEEAIISVNKGFLDLNLNRPLFLWIYQNNQPIFVFIAHGKEILNKPDTSLPFILLGSDRFQFSYKKIVVKKSYSPEWSFQITKNRIQSYMLHINSVFPSFMIFFYLSLLLIFPLLFMIVSTSIILIFSVLVFILLRTFIPQIKLNKCIQAGLHGTHIPLLVAIFLFALFPSMINVITIAAALVFIFTLVATYEMYSKEVLHQKK